MLLPYYPAIVLSGINPRELKLKSTQKLQADVYSSFIYNCPNLEAVKMSAMACLDVSLPRFMC
jgi:hypothetical protein